jgi:hypothetical protein
MLVAFINPTPRYSAPSTAPNAIEIDYHLFRTDHASLLTPVRLDTNLLPSDKIPAHTHDGWISRSAVCVEFIVKQGGTR